MVLLLDNVRSVHNVGSIFRTADAMGGIGFVHLGGITPTPLDRLGRPRPDFVKVSLGAEKTLVWKKSVSLGSVIKKLKKDRYQIWSVEQTSRSHPYHRVGKKLPVKLALIMGNEIKGINPKILALSDKIIDIPMAGQKESLNVSVAFGIIAYHLKYLCQKR